MTRMTSWEAGPRGNPAAMRMVRITKLQVGVIWPWHTLGEIITLPNSPCRLTYHVRLVEAGIT